jgi:hypothetical protein
MCLRKEGKYLCRINYEERLPFVFGPLAKRLLSLPTFTFHLPLCPMLDTVKLFPQIVGEIGWFLKLE